MRAEDVVPTLTRRISEFVVGQHEAVELLLAALGARQHVLLEGAPGTAKTLLALTIAKCAGLSFSRVQMTADLWPSDLVGASVWLQPESRFEFRNGPVFTNLLLADEVNRAPPKTQAALFEAMQERQVTVDGVTRSLPDQFWVIATANPLEHAGTYPLPDSELDKFALRVTLDYPSPAEERSILAAQCRGHEPLEQLRALGAAEVGPEDLRAWQQRIREVEVDDKLLGSIEMLARATRKTPDLAVGAGPRAGLALMRLGQALAFARGRPRVRLEDVRALVLPVFSHRVRIAPEAQVSGVTVRTVLARIVAAVWSPDPA